MLASARLARVKSSNGLPAARRHLASRSPLLKISDEVQQALAEKKPIVALESTIFTHGYPYPENVALASHLETIVRSNGGVPATIGVLDGVSRVGLSHPDLERLASSAGQPDTLKVSRRDLAFACGLSRAGKPYNGGTTVAGTMVLAHMAGIRVFATGGLGGVHRGAESSMDISADLTELGRTPVAVIASGCKSFLDISRTLEYLETEGVPVATFADGRTGHVDFPAFWARDSGCRSPMVLGDEIEAARVIHAQHTLGIKTGLLFANPIPEEHSIPRTTIDRAIESALKQAAQDGITGNASTPYILAKIRDLTESRSMAANTALVESNVARGTRLARELAKLESQVSHHMPQTMVTGPGAVNYSPQGLSYGLPKPAGRVSPLPAEQPSHFDGLKSSDIFIAGSLAIDLACNFKPSDSDKIDPATKTSNPATISQSLGGVAHNMARAAQLAGANVQLCSAVGDDIAGRAALEAMTAEGLDASLVHTLAGTRTAQYVAINNANKDLVLAMSDMSLIDGEHHQGQDMDIGTIFETSWRRGLEDARPAVVGIDANWPPSMLGRWLEAAKSIGATTIFEPVSTAKSARLFDKAFGQLGVWPEPSLDIATPNMHELEAMHAAAKRAGLLDRNDWWQVIDSLGIPSSGIRRQLALATNNQLVDQGIPQQCIQLLPFIPTMIVKLGSAGVLLVQILSEGDGRLASGEAAPYVLSRNTSNLEDCCGVGGLYVRLFPPVDQLHDDEIVSVNGIGDTFVGVMLAGIASRGKSVKVEDLVDAAQSAAVMTLKSEAAVSTDVAQLKPWLASR